MRLVALAALCFCAFAKASITPQVLIVTRSADKGREASLPDALKSLGQYFAEAIDEDGRVSPVVWSMTDPFFRAAVDDRILRDFSAFPSFDEARTAAQKLKIDYLCVVTIKKDEEAAKAKAELYLKGKLVWQDPSLGTELDAAAQKARDRAEAQAKKNKIKLPDLLQNGAADYRIISVLGEGPNDFENAARSMARTWSVLLGNTAFKNLPSRKQSPTPPADAGNTTVKVDVPPVKPVDNQELLVQFQKLINSGKSFQAIVLLRESVDAEPMNLERRRLLISALSAGGLFRLAAEEARRSTRLATDPLEFHVLAAQAWMRVGNTDEAQQDLNEAIARDPDRPLVRSLLGEINLTNLQLQQAVNQFTFVIEKAPTADAYFGRGLGLMVGGDLDNAEKDFAESDRLGLTKDLGAQTSRYLWVTSIEDASCETFSKEMRELLPRARLNRSDESVKKDLVRLNSVAAGLAKLSARMTAPAKFKSSSERRLLALNLLSQSVSDLESFLTTGDEDVIADATLNFGEALKQLASARETQQAETDRS